MLRDISRLTTNKGDIEKRLDGCGSIGDHLTLLHSTLAVLLSLLDGELNNFVAEKRAEKTKHSPHVGLAYFNATGSLIKEVVLRKRIVLEDFQETSEA